MTDQKDKMPDEIWAHEVDRCTVYMSGASPINAYDRPIKHPRLGEPTKYLRADKSMVRDILKANQMQAEKIRELKKERDLLARYVYNPNGDLDPVEGGRIIGLARKIVEGDKDVL